MLLKLGLSEQRIATMSETEAFAWLDASAALNEPDKPRTKKHVVRKKQ